MKRLAIATTTLLAAVRAHAADAPETPSWQETVAKFAGCWDGTGLGGDVAFCWMPGPGGRMTAAFQKTDEDGFDFSEIIYIADFGEGPELRLKHFDPALVGWEEKEKFLSTKLEAWTDDTLDFGWLRYTFAHDGRIEVELDMRTADGSNVQTLVFDKID